MLLLRPFQKEALNLLESSPSLTQHLLCISPTGSGKSLIYEKLSAQTGRKTLLISPLIALARQQSEKLRKIKIPTYLGVGDSKEYPSANQSGVWIVSPESLQFNRTKFLLQAWRPDLLVVDECHCLWEWGETFRPAFQLIPQLLEISSIKKSLWLTATLPQQARLELKELLSPHFLEIGRFQLPDSIFLEVRQVQHTQRHADLLDWLRLQDKPGIVFTGTRESTLRLAGDIKKINKSPLIYHAGLSKEERLKAEQNVCNSPHQVIIATSAFGMGMNYPKLSYVALWQPTPTLLSLVQGIGRVGRHLNALNYALIYWDFDDFRLLEWTLRKSQKNRTELKNVLNFLNSPICRRAYLDHYFNDSTTSYSCKRCDYCVNFTHSTNSDLLNLPIGRWLKNC